MNLGIYGTVLLVGVLPLFALVAAFSDLASYTIPNWLTGALAALYVPAALAVGLPPSEIAMALGAGAAVLAIGFGLFSLGWLGGGDAKLAAGMACWLGWDQLLPFALITAILGGILAVLLLSFRAVPAGAWIERHRILLRLHDPDEGVPYGLALGAAALWLYSQTSVWIAYAHLN